MRQPSRTFLYAAIGFVCVGLLVQGTGLRLPKLLNALGAVSSATQTLQASVQSPAPPVGATVATPDGPGTVVGHNVPADTVVVKLSADGRACACPKASVCGSRQAYEEMHVKPRSAGDR